MKISPITRLNLALLLLVSLTLAPAGLAADRYHFNFSLSGKTTNEIGQLVSQSVNRGFIMKEVSHETGIPTSDLALILERSSGLVLLVDREFGTNITVVLRLSGDLSVSNTNQTKSVVYLEVDHPEEDNIDGSAVGSVSIKRDGLGAETSFKVSGKIHVASEEQEDEPTKIYSGVFSTGAVFTPRQAP